MLTFMNERNRNKSRRDSPTGYSPTANQASTIQAARLGDPSQRNVSCAFKKYSSSNSEHRQRGPNPTGFQMACRPVVFCEPQQPTGGVGGGARGAL